MRGGGPLPAAFLHFFLEAIFLQSSFCHKLRTNRYDEDEIEYWVDVRTEGLRGSDERDGVLESGKADADGFASRALDAGPLPITPAGSSDENLPGLNQEQGMKAGFLQCVYYSIKRS